jgi:hypothetical protein
MQEISATKQKILIIGLVGVLILAIVMIGVMFLGGDKDNKKSIDNSAQVTQQESKAADKNKKGTKAESDFLKIAINDVYGLKMKKGTNQIMFYQQQKLLSADPFSGKKHSVGSYPFSEVTEFLWSKESDKAIVKDTGDYYIYESSSNLAYKFRYGIDTAIWNNNGNKIIYKYYNPDTKKRKIEMADTKGENRQLIAEGLPYRKIDLILQPEADSICYFPHPDARVKGKLFCKSLNGEIKKEYGGRYGQDYLWSSDGNKILTSFTQEESGNQIVLGVINKSGGDVKGLSMGTTVKKCVWSKNSIDVYCATLGGAPLAIMLPNAWDEQLFNSVDTFWKINTETGEKKRLVNLEDMTIAMDSENLTLDVEENFLFFVNRKDRSLWRLKL